MLPLLQGTRILDFTTIVLGPYATQTLGDLGADVIKIEPLQGDLYRTVRPGRSRDMGAGFVNFNRNKRSLAIDLKRAESRAGARPAGARRGCGRAQHAADARPHQLGIDYARLAAINPALVYAFSAGYDQSGPNAGRAGLRRRDPGRGRRCRTQCERASANRAISRQCSATRSAACISRSRLPQRARPPRADRRGLLHRGADVRKHRVVPDDGAAGRRLVRCRRSARPATTGCSHRIVDRSAPVTGTWRSCRTRRRTGRAFFELIGRPEQAHSPQVQDPVVRSREHRCAVCRDRRRWRRRELAPSGSRGCAGSTFPARGSTRSATCCRTSTCARPVSSASTIIRRKAGMRDARSPFRLHGAPEQADRPTPRTGADGREILARSVTALRRSTGSRLTGLVAFTG